MKFICRDNFGLESFLTENKIYDGSRVGTNKVDIVADDGRPCRFNIERFDFALDVEE